MNNKIPIISIIGPAIRGEQAYRQVYNSIKTDKVPFEFVFAGPEPPKNSMPENFHYIVTDVKPPQCAEIAARAATGEYILTGSDDVVYSENYLEMMYFYIRRFDMNRTVLLNRFKIGKGVFEYTCLWSANEIDNAPITMAVSLIKKSIWHEIGGVDRRYLTVCWDTDMQLRCYERGMNPFIVPQLLVTECDTSKNTHGKPRLTERRFGKLDSVDLTTSFWIKDKSFSNKRLSPVQSFDDKDILVVDQN